ncbi:hypothetical protein [Amycolatopsis kentuckyensis]|uniref:hypothetical protein n=1 Tax=Amycolatopsis kentuckyensis TaxID=218823 RepID=UPI003565CFDA
MATITRAQAKISGTVLTATPATAGPDKVAPGDSGAGTYVFVQNGGGASITVNVADPNAPKYGQTLPPITSVPVPAAGVAVIGPIPADLAQPSDALAWLTASATASVNFYAFRG